jgi:hypothetical protein
MFHKQMQIALQKIHVELGQCWILKALLQMLLFAKHLFAEVGLGMDNEWFHKLPQTQ